MAEVVPLQAGPAEPAPSEPVRITYVVDDDACIIYWRCEREECPSRIEEPGKPTRPFVGLISFEDRAYGMALLGAVAVSHAFMLDQQPLEAMTLGEITEGDET